MYARDQIAGFVTILSRANRDSGLFSERYRTGICMAVGVAALTAPACRGVDPPAPTSTSVTQPAEAAPAGLATPGQTAPDQWLGQWNGPEGTFLYVSKRLHGFEITIQSLDGAESYAATAVDDHLEFKRNGITTTIRASDGRATGMKWLLDKSSCLTIRQGEGFCKD